MKKDMLIKSCLGVLSFMTFAFGYGCLHLYNSQSNTDQVPEIRLVPMAHAIETEEQIEEQLVVKSESKTEQSDVKLEEKEKTSQIDSEKDELSQLTSISVDGQSEDFVVIKKSTLIKLKEEKDFLTEKNLILAKQQIKDREHYEQSLRDKELEFEKKLTLATNDFNQKLESANTDKVKMMNFIKKQNKHISELDDTLKEAEQEYALLLQKLTEKNKVLNSKTPSMSEVSSINMSLTKVQVVESVKTEPVVEKNVAEKVVLKSKKEKQQDKINPLSKFSLVGISQDFIMLKDRTTGREYSLIVGERLSGVPLKKINHSSGTVTFSNGYVMSVSD